MTTKVLTLLALYLALSMTSTKKLRGLNEPDGRVLQDEETPSGGDDNQPGTVIVAASGEILHALGDAVNTEGVKDVVNEAVNAAGDAVNAVGNIAGNAVNAMGNAAGDTLGAAEDAVNAVGNVAGDAVNAVWNAAGDVRNAVGNAVGDDTVNAVWNAASDVGNAVGNVAGDAVDSFANK